MGYSTGYKTKFEKHDNFLFVMFICGALPLMAWRFSSDTVWPDLILKGYSLTAPLFGFLLPLNYPPVRSQWFWNAMLPISLLHLAVLTAFVKLTLYFAYIQVKLPARELCVHRRSRLRRKLHLVTRHSSTAAQTEFANKDNL
jgi:hypothetical protein